MKKRLLSLIMAVMMVVVLVVPAAAATTDTTSGGPDDDGRRGPAAGRAENAPDGVYHAAAASGAAYELYPPCGGSGRKINKAADRSGRRFNGSGTE